MVKVLYNDENVKKECAFKRISDHVVELKGGKENASGFLTFRLDETQLGDFSDYTTIHKVTEDAVQYSNDGSVYVGPIGETFSVDNAPTVEERLDALESAMFEMLLGGAE